MVLDYERIRAFLKAGSNAVTGDQKIFRMWEEGKISTVECIDMFKKNNDIEEPIIVLVPDFIRFMNDLGYRRRREWREER